MKSDIFSIGTIMYNLLTNRNLFKGKNPNETLKLNLECNIANVKSHLKSSSLQAIDLVYQLLNKNPAFRYSAEQALNHPWFAQEKPLLEKSLNLNKLITCYSQTPANSEQFQQPWNSSQHQPQKNLNSTYHPVVNSHLIAVGPFDLNNILPAEKKSNASGYH